MLHVKGQSIPVLNHACTPQDYATAFRKARLQVEFALTYDPKILYFATPQVTRAHLVLVGKKSDIR